MTTSSCKLAPYTNRATCLNLLKPLQQSQRNSLISITDAPSCCIKIKPLSCHQLISCFPNRPLIEERPYIKWPTRGSDNTSSACYTQQQPIPLAEEGISRETMCQVRVDQVTRLDVVGCEDASDEQTLTIICYSGHGYSISGIPIESKGKI